MCESFQNLPMNWSLDALYTSFDDLAFQKDFERLADIPNIVSWAVQAFAAPGEPGDPAPLLEKYIRTVNGLSRCHLMFHYASLLLSVDASRSDALKMIDRIEDAYAALAEADALFKAYVGRLPQQMLDACIAASPLLAEHRFFLSEIKAEYPHVLSDKEELLMARLRPTGSGAWSTLMHQLTSRLMVEMEKDGAATQIPLAVVRNYATDADPKLRKAAYEAELAAYPKIDTAVAFALNNIKGEVITACDLRHYDSPLQMTLFHYRLDEEALHAMLGAMQNALPVFHSYLRKKAEMLGHSNGLPFYDLYAPLTSPGAALTYTFDEAACFVVRQFTAFSPRLGQFAAHAFTEGWIDAQTREGKQGGAFCENLFAIGQSRILSNFTGTFNDVMTLAHELGHAYHGDCLKAESYLNSDYPMPIAETASTFCETLVFGAALRSGEITPAQKLEIMESDLSNAAAIVVDIYSRYLFESKGFEQRKNGSLSVEELNEMMLDAQRQTYGDGLDPNCLHPYMWACKSHYYYADNNYYNFPYAFGLLFAKGLYAQYLQTGDTFVEKYDRMLAATGKNNLKDVAASMGVDISDKAFWESSLAIIAKDIERFLAL